MGAIAIIPARGGSKRLPRKNILPFCGRPILAYTIEAALRSRCFEMVVVSTEDEAIAEAGRRWGAEVLMRPSELATDTAGVVAVCRHVLEDASKRGHRFERMGCLYATAPLRTAEDIRATMDLLDPGRCDFAMAVTTYPFSPHQALRAEEETGRLKPVWPEMIHLKSQEVGTLLVDNGSTYGVNVEAFLSAESFYGKNLRGHVMPRLRSVDIDEAEDFNLAEMIAQRLRK